MGLRKWKYRFRELSDTLPMICMSAGILGRPGTRRPVVYLTQVLVFGSIYEGYILVHVVEPQPHGAQLGS